MAQYDNTNRGALFPNDRKTPGSRQPDYKGSINIEGVEYWVSGWVKDTTRGEIVSMSVEKKEGGPGRPQQSAPRAQGPRTLGGASRAQPQPQNQPSQSTEPPMDFDDDIPFAPAHLPYGRIAVWALS